MHAVVVTVEFAVRYTSGIVLTAIRSVVLRVRLFPKSSTNKSTERFPKVEEELRRQPEQTAMDMEFTGVLQLHSETKTKPSSLVVIVVLLSLKSNASL